MNVLIWLLVATAAVVAYAVFLRPYLRKQSWAEPFFRFVEPIELVLFKKSEGILWARWQQFLGLVLTVVGMFGGIDWTALAVLTPDWIDPLLPAIPLLLNLTGSIAEKLRNDTTKPIELVAIPEADKEVPAVAAAIATAEVAKIEAVAAVEVAKVAS